MTEKEFLARMKKVRREIQSLGADLVPIDGVRFKRGVSPIGLCIYRDRENPSCIIEFSRAALNFDDLAVHEVIAHELLHSIRGSIAHGPLFQEYAALMNRKFGLDIGSYSSAHLVKEGIRHRIYNYVVRCKECDNLIGYVRRAEVVRELIEYGKAPDYYCPYCRSQHLVLDEDFSRKGHAPAGGEKRLRNAVSA